MRLRDKAELLDPVADLIAIEAEQLRGLAVVPVTAFQCLHKELALDLLHLHSFRWRPELRRHRGRARELKVVEFDPLVSGQQHGPLDRVAQLADIPGHVCLSIAATAAGVRPLTRRLNSRL
jgi:hypothetical protein